MKRFLAILLTGGLLLLGSLAFTGVATAATPGPTTRCSDGVDNTCLLYTSDAADE